MSQENNKFNSIKKIVQFILGHNSYRESLLEVAVAIYIATLFISFAAGLRDISMWLSFFIWTFGVKKPYLKAVLQNRIFLLSLSLIAFALVSALWSQDSRQTISDWQRDFDDYFAIIPAIIHICLRPDAPKRLLRIFSLAGVSTILANGGQYLYEYINGIHLYKDLRATHYGWALPLVMFSPFLLAEAQNKKGTQYIFWMGCFVVTGLMLLPTGARGAWLAFFAVTVIYFTFTASLKRLACIAALFILAAGAIYLAAPKDSIVALKINQGFDTSGRVNGTWRPAIEMSFKKPWLGYGFGKKIYKEEYDKQVGANPHWPFQTKIMTPHNFYLLALFSLGAIGGGILIILICFIASSYILSKGDMTGKPYQSTFIAFFSAFLGHYVVRATFETLTWKPLAVFLGVAVGLSVARALQPSRNSTDQAWLDRPLLS